MKKELSKLFDTNNNLDPKSLDSLASALVTQSLEGFDYLKFKQSLHSLIKMGQTEEMAYKSAFATAVTIGATKKKIIQTAQHYLQLLAREKHQFDNAFKKQLHQKVDSKLNETEFFREKIVNYRSKIAELEEEIALMEKKIGQVDVEVAKSKDRILQTQIKFEETYAHFQKAIQEDIGLMEKYL